MADQEAHPDVFGREISPDPHPRDHKGQFIETHLKPEPIFSSRELEGDETGDTRGGGDDDDYRARERQLADGDEQGTRGRTAKNGQNLQRASTDAEGDEAADDEQGDQGAVQSGDEEAVDDGEKYEVLVEGNVYHVSFNEMQRGYIRQATFHQQMERINRANVELENSAAQLRQGWADWSKARADYEEDLNNLIPQEPNWDQEFAVNPQGAHATQRIFQALYGKLAWSRQSRANREAAEAQNTEARIRKYAVEGYNKFVMDNAREIPDDATLKKEIQSMRRTARDAGFNEYETATVYDPRMLTVLRWASRFRRMTANLPKAVIPGRGKTLTPGAATPLSGNARRKGLDDAQRQLAQSGRIDDAAEVFRRML